MQSNGAYSGVVTHIYHQVHATTCSTVGVAFLCQAIGIEVRSPVALVLVCWSAAVCVGVKDHQFSFPTAVAWNAEKTENGCLHFILHDYNYVLGFIAVPGGRGYFRK